MSDTHIQSVLCSLHGMEPFSCAVIHGGPGAWHDVAPVARILSSIYGVLEPLQTTLSVDSEIDELYDTLTAFGKVPRTLIGHSWGAWLALLTAARYPDCARKVIIIGAGPFEQSYAHAIDINRRSRMTEVQQKKYDECLYQLQQDDIVDTEKIGKELGLICRSTDMYDPLPEDETYNDSVEFKPDIFAKVWPEAAALRKSGELLERVRRVACPVVVIHGTYDPHPVDGVRIPLKNVLSDCSFHVLDKCGHSPWKEKHAHDECIDILRAECAVE